MTKDCTKNQNNQDVSCSQIQNLLSAYVDNEASEQEVARISIHLKACAECRAYLDFLQRLHGSCEEIPQVPLPQNYMYELHAKLVAEVAANGINTCYNLTDFQENAEVKQLKKSGNFKEIPNEIPNEMPKEMPIEMSNETSVNCNKKFWQKSWFPRTVAACIMLGVGLSIGGIIYNDRGEVAVGGDNLQVASAEPRMVEPVAPSKISALDGKARVATEGGQEVEILAESADQIGAGPIDYSKQVEGDNRENTFVLASRGSIFETPYNFAGVSLMSIGENPLPINKAPVSKTPINKNHSAASHGDCFGDTSSLAANYLLVGSDNVLTVKNYVSALVGSYNGSVISNVDECRASKNHACLKAKIPQQDVQDFITDVEAYGLIIDKQLIAADSKSSKEVSDASDSSDSSDSSDVSDASDKSDLSLIVIEFEPAK